MRNLCRYLLVLLLIVGLVAPGALANPLSEEPNSGSSHDQIVTFIIIGAFLIAIPITLYLAHHAELKGRTQFLSEEITFTVNPEGVVHVSADYVFHNPRKGKYNQPIIYPFPGDSDLQAPQNPVVQVVSETGREPLKVALEDHQWKFNLPLEAQTINILHVEYDQVATAERFTYILTSTKSWEQPLQSALFVIRLPEGCKLSSSSYECQPETASSGGYAYTIYRSNFLPEKDLEFSWGK